MSSSHPEIPQDWSDDAGVSRIQADATSVLRSAREQANSLRRRAYMDGHAAGFAKAQADTVRQALEAQRKAREFIDASGQHIVAMALASIECMACMLGPATVITAILTEALETLKTQRQLRVSVSQGAVKATRAMLARWQLEHPQTDVRVLVDPDLEPFGCRVESELGCIDLGMRKQLAAAREELTARAAVPVAMPATDTAQGEFGYEWSP